MMKKNHVLTKFGCIIFTILILGLNGCAQIGKFNNLKETTNSQDSQVYSGESLDSSEIPSEYIEEYIIAQALGIPESDALQESIRMFHDRGCKKIEQAEKINEENGWIYFSVIDSNEQKYYLDTNKKGYFGTILTKAGYDNAHRMSEELEISWNRNLLYSAEKLENLGCGSIQSITEISNERVIQFSIENEKNRIYKICISKEGILGEVRKQNGYILYRERE